MLFRKEEHMFENLKDEEYDELLKLVQQVTHLQSLVPIIEEEEYMHGIKDALYLILMKKYNQNTYKWLQHLDPYQIRYSFDIILDNLTFEQFKTKIKEYSSLN